MSELEHVRYETPGNGVARIVLAREKQRNAQGKRMTYELNECMNRAARDDAIKVIVLAADGPHFSSGHDLRDSSKMDEFESISTFSGFSKPGAEGRQAVEEEIYFGMCWRWRNIPKPTIAQVQGKCIAGGLMLAWPCDLIVCAEDAAFCDNTVGMGVAGVEYFAHPWELGPRKAKELLFTADWLSATEAKALGMVNHVVPPDQLGDFTLALAVRIAAKPMFALKMAKEAVNAAEDAQGRVGAMNTAFALHQLAHSHNMQVHGMPVDPSGLQVRRKQ